MDGQKAFHRLRCIVVLERGLATPVSMLIIFFSLTFASTIAYHFAITRVDAKKEDLKFVAVQEKILGLDEAISSIVWSPGSSRIIAFSDYGGEFRVEPNGSHLELKLLMNGSNDTVFNHSIGRFLYKLQYASSNAADTWLRGDQRVIVSSGSSQQSRVRIELGDEGKELVVDYRPLVSWSLGGMMDGRRINNIRIYVISLNRSQSIVGNGEFYVKAYCSEIFSEVKAYNLTSSVISVDLMATLNGSVGTVEVPITSGPSGSTVRVETLVCRIELLGVSA